MTKRTHYTILGISPTNVGFGFAVMEPQGELVSWGVARLYSKNEEEFLQRLDALCRQYRVRVICVEDMAGSRKREKARRKIGQVLEHARGSRREAVQMPMARVREMLGVDRKTAKYELAKRLVSMLPELEAVLPEPRKIWQGEDARMSVFEAIGLTVASERYHEEEPNPPGYRRDS